MGGILGARETSVVSAWLTSGISVSDTSKVAGTEACGMRSGRFRVVEEYAQAKAEPTKNGVSEERNQVRPSLVFRMLKAGTLACLEVLEGSIGVARRSSGAKR
jgi:hypothetical protein